MLFLINLPSIAQTVIEGKISEKQTFKPISSVIITAENLSNKDNLGFTFSDEKGNFKMQIQSKSDSVGLTVTLLGYTIRKFRLPNKNQSINVSLQPEGINLKEVRVEAPKISYREDTLSYSVDAFKNNNDKVIGDILKKLPGIEVKDNGAILYNGDPINKFYIEGLDLLENKYGIATNNVPADAISNVQVIENHQSIKSLKNIISSDKAAINLKLKNDKISKIVGTAEVGAGGSPLLWKSNLFGMRIAKENQALSTYKSNNTGTNIVSELNSHDIIDDILSGKPAKPSELMTPTTIGTPPTDQSRYLFNKSHVVSLNNIWKKQKDAYIRLNMSYINDENKQTLKEKNSYYFSDTDSLINEENNSLKSYTNQLNALITYNINSQAYYLNNNLTFNGSWMNTNSYVNGSSSLSQHFQTPNYSFENDLNIIKKSDKRVYTINSFVRYSALPQQLKVNQDSIAMTQDSRLKKFQTTNSLSYGYLWTNSNLLIKLNVDASLDDLKSNLNNAPINIETENNLNTNSISAGITPTYTHLLSALKITAALPISTTIFSVENTETEKNKSYTYLFITPSLSVSYTINPYWKANLSYRYNEDIGNSLDFTNAYRMINYRSFQKGAEILSRRKSQTTAGSITFRDPLTALFFNFRASYNKTDLNLMQETTFNSIYSLSSRIAQKNSRKMWVISSNVGKYISSLQATISLGCSYNQTESYRLQQGNPIQSQNRSFTLQPKIDIMISNTLSLTYNANITQNKTTIKNWTENPPALLHTYQLLRCYISPTSSWQIKLECEHYYNELSANNNSKLFFANISTSYKIKDFEISVLYNNIFNQKHFSYSSYDGSNRFFLEYELRPVNIIASVGFKF